MDDLTEVALELIERVIAQTEVEDVSMSHVVITYDPVSGAHSCVGPYVDAIEAMRAADRLRRELSLFNGVDDTACSIMVLPLRDPR